MSKPKQRIRKAHRGSFFVLLMAISFVIASGSCALINSDECKSGDDYCEGGVAYVCASRPTTLASYGWLSTRCRGQNLCRVVEGRAFCTLTEQPHEQCLARDGSTPAGGFFCDGRMSVLCHRGFPVQRNLCESCSGEADCAPLHPPHCDKDAPCPEGFVCSAKHELDKGLCNAPCDCKEGEPCAACEFLGEHAERGWLCEKGVCRQREF